MDVTYTCITVFRNTVCPVGTILIQPAAGARLRVLTLSGSGEVCIQGRGGISQNYITLVGKKKYANRDTCARHPFVDERTVLCRLLVDVHCCCRDLCTTSRSPCRSHISPELDLPLFTTMRDSIMRMRVVSLMFARNLLSTRGDLRFIISYRATA